MANSERGSQKRILLLTNEYRPVGGGIATYCHGLISTLAAEGHDVVVVAAAKGADASDFDQQQPYPIYRTHEHRFALARYAVRWQALRRAIAQHQPDWLWASDWRTGSLIAAAAALYKIPFSVSAYGSELLSLNSSTLKRQVAKNVMRQSEAVLSISHYTTQLLTQLGIEANHVRTIIPGTMPALFDVPASERDRIRARYGLGNRPVIITLARLVPRKGHRAIISVLPEIIKKVPDVIYLVAGQGPQADPLRQQAATLGIEKHVLFAGFVPESEKAAYYAASDLYILLNHADGDDVEGFGITLLEAAAAGKPVIAGNHGGAIDALLPDESGRLVDPTDNAAIYDAIIPFLQDPSLAQRFGAAGRRYVSDYANWERAAAQFIHLIDQTM